MGFHWILATTMVIYESSTKKHGIWTYNQDVSTLSNHFMVTNIGTWQWWQVAYQIGNRHPKRSGFEPSWSHIGTIPSNWYPNMCLYIYLWLYIIMYVNTVENIYNTSTYCIWYIIYSIYIYMYIYILLSSILYIIHNNIYIYICVYIDTVHFILYYICIY